MSLESIAEEHHTPPEAVAMLAEHGLPPTYVDPDNVTDFETYRERRDGE